MAEPVSGSVSDAAESDRAGPVIAWRYQQQLAVLVFAIGLGEIPDRALRLIVVSAAQDGAARVRILIFVRPLLAYSEARDKTVPKHCSVGRKT